MNELDNTELQLLVIERDEEIKSLKKELHFLNQTIKELVECERLEYINNPSA